MARPAGRCAARRDGHGGDGFRTTRRLSAELEPAGGRATRGSAATPAPPAEAVSRAEWAEVNLESLAQLLDPVADRLDKRLASAGPLAGALRAGATATWRPRRGS